MKEDFGLVNCSSCGSPVLLGMDGEVGLPDAPEPVAQEQPTAQETPVTNEFVIEEFVVEEFVQDEEVADAPEVPEEPIDPSDMGEVMEFANSEESNALDGNLKFNLKISGIDTIDIKTGIKEVLLDSKLHLDPEQTIAKVEAGELYLEGLSAVKCAILVQRLKALSIEIGWEQYAIQQA